MSSRSDTWVTHQHYTNAEWIAQRPLITRLYATEGKSVKAVINVLASRNFHVNKRMIMTRVTQWGIGRKNKMHEMCAVVRLLANDDFNVLSGSTTFTIRGKIVTLNEVWRYFKRKGITNPADYVRRQPLQGRDLALDVRLEDRVYRNPTVPSESSSSQLETPETEVSDSPLSSLSPILESANDVAEIGTHFFDQQALNEEVEQALSLNSGGPWQLEEPPYIQGDSFGLHLFIPTTCQHNDTMLWAVQTYIAIYTQSLRQQSHYEPKAHYKTPYGRFSFLIQEGVASKQRVDVLSTRDAYRRAFDLIDGIIADDHPMSIMLILSLMCELLKGGNIKVVEQISKRIIEANVKLQRLNHPIRSLFQALLDIDGLQNQHLYRALRLASNYFSTQMTNTDWRSMYLKERLCDALYHSDENVERVMLRRQLLQEQVLQYGHDARNVLFTQMNVADDFVIDAEFDQAESLYMDALTRAEQLTDDGGFNRARVRFGALEGLGNSKWKQAERSASIPWGSTAVYAVQLDQAHEHYSLAATEAERWFDAESKRSVRILQKKKEAEYSLARCQPLPDFNEVDWTFITRMVPVAAGQEFHSATN